jgi:hypothetical protein
MTRRDLFKMLAAIPASAVAIAALPKLTPEQRQAIVPVPKKYTLSNSWVALDNSPLWGRYYTAEDLFELIHSLPKSDFSVDCESMEITTCSDSIRRYMPGPTTFRIVTPDWYASFIKMSNGTFTMTNLTYTFQPVSLNDRAAVG